MILVALIMLISLAIVIISAEIVVKSLLVVSNFFKLSPFFISVIVLGFGSSLPELFLSLSTTIRGDSVDVLVGNINGSILLNILVVGLAAVFTNGLSYNNNNSFKIGLFGTVVSSGSLFLVSILFGGVGLVSGWVFLLLFVFYLFWQKKAEVISDLDKELPKNQQQCIIYCFVMFFSLIMLLYSSSELIDRTLYLAKYFDISDIIISSTILAIGTSLPELAITISSVIKKQHSVSIGNIVGSNIFNILICIGAPALIRFVDIDNVLTMLVIFMSSMIFALILYLNNVIKRYYGLLFITFYFIYILYIK